MVKWQKVGSVTKGGKPYFWFRKTVKYYIWVVWDRHEKLWKVKIENIKTGKEVYQYFGTDKQGKKAVDTNYDDWIAYI